MKALSVPWPGLAWKMVPGPSLIIVAIHSGSTSTGSKDMAPKLLPPSRDLHTVRAGAVRGPYTDPYTLFESSEVIPFEA